MGSRSRPAGRLSQFQSDNLFVKHCVFLFYDHVLMVVSKKPVSELAPLPQLIEEVCQLITLVQPAAKYVLYAGGAAVGDDVVHRPW